MRNDFYTAAQDVATANGSTVVWPQMAADVTRGMTLGTHDWAVNNFSYDKNTIKLSQDINRAIFADAFNAFGTGLLFSPPLTGSAADSFDRLMVGREQNAAQPFYNAYTGTPEFLSIGANRVAINFTTCWFSGAPCAPTTPDESNIKNLNDRLKFGNKLVDFYRK